MRLVGGLRWGWLEYAAGAQRVSVHGYSSVNILCVMWKLCSNLQQQIRAGLKHCSLRGASLITAAVVTTLLKFPAVDFLAWCYELGQILFLSVTACFI